MIRSLKYLNIPTDKPWLILGKGPSFSRIWETKVSDFHLLGLNETVSEVTCEIGHFIDLEPLCNLKNIYYPNTVIIPFHPHINSSPAKVLDHYYNKFPILVDFAKSEKLYTYNLSTYKGVQKHNNAPYITAKFFSAEAAFRILANAGVRQFYSLGIDGGNKYAKEFKHLKPLTNGRANFDQQFVELYKIINNHKASWVQL